MWNRGNNWSLFVRGFWCKSSFPSEPNSAFCVFREVFLTFCSDTICQKKVFCRPSNYSKKKCPRSVIQKYKKQKKERYNDLNFFPEVVMFESFVRFFLVLFSKVFALSLTLFVWNALFFFVFLPLLVFLVKVTNITTFYTKLKVLFFLGSFWVKKRSEPPQKLTSFGKCLLLVERAECVLRPGGPYFFIFL